MVTDAAAMAVVRAARPALRGAHDGVAFAAHATFLAAGYSLCAVGPSALTDPPPSGEEEVGIDGWNSMENCYAFLYTKEENAKKKRVLVKCLVIGDLLAIDVLDLEAQHEGPYNIQINVKDFFSEEHPKNYGDMYKNFAGLIETVNSNVLSKLDGKDAGAAAAKNPDAESSSSIHNSENPGPRTTEPSGYPGPRTIEPSGLVYPPIAPLGSDDLYPAPGAGFYPHSGIGSGGSMHVGPNDPRFFPSNPFPAPFGGPGSVPPGGRYDPIGPPDVPGFEPSRFVRRARRPGGSTHPDLEFFQQGPDF
ncbi:probable proteasome inhibitor isoform X2 [Phragmites australis]|uniref:probable proteasome inhibitor isoform X2 n=1 Tax=Phragmites australis TaxID=29695 RepID=UPI002D784546|nr:probable proteasome inhibitor isoform X2 [Phragmites australis]